MIHRCNAQTVTGVAASTPFTSVTTPLKHFFAMIPDFGDQVEIARMAIITQVLRTDHEGNKDYAQCIVKKLIQPTDSGMAPPGFLEMFRQLGVYKTSAIPVEKFFVGTIIHFCGKEPVAAGAPGAKK